MPEVILYENIRKFRGDKPTGGLLLKELVKAFDLTNLEKDQTKAT
jgi:hypothetical protein